MSCIICSDPGENIGTESNIILVHKEVGACWEPFFHTFDPRGGDPNVAHVRRIFNPRDKKRAQVPDDE